MTTLISGGTVVSSTGSARQDVLIDGETIAAVVAPGSTALGDLAASADRVIDATGKYVIPGGVDGHTHMEMPFGGTFASDTFETGTRAAAWGGTTTIVDFVVQTHGQRVLDQFALWHEKAGGNCAVDYAFHQIIGEVDDDSLKAMDALIDEGVTSFKLFMAYPGVFLSSDGQIVRAMQTAAGNGGLIMMHAENGSAIDVLVQQALARGETAPYYHGVTRPWQTEQEATHRAVMLANLTGAPLYVVHVSAKQALARIAEARNAGQNVFGETCPQYLYLSLEENLGAPGFEGAKWVCSTPLRARAEGHQDELWRYIRTGDVTTVSTDHCPFCMKDQKEMGIGNFAKIPNGIGSVEHRIDLLYQGVVDGRISLERWVDVCCASPARTFGLYGKKGVIAAGADADVVVYDPAGHTSIGIGEGRTHHMNMDYSAWEGYEIDGHVDVVISRGQVLVEGGSYVGTKSHGKYVKRGLSQNLVYVMDFGVVLQTDPPAWRVVELSRQAEQAGFTHVWTFDSHILWQEPFVIYSQILAATHRLTVGPIVTNPATRDWTVTASLFATLNDMFGNRTVCGIGRGDSAVRVINGAPVTLATLREAIEVIRPLANGGQASYKGSLLRFPWSSGSVLPIWVAAYGPKALALAGEIGDGFILQLADPDITAWSIAAVRKAASDAGRDPASVQICVAAPAYVTDGSDEGLDHARSQCRWFGGMVGNHVADIVARYGTDGGAVPKALSDYIANRSGYDYNTHGKAANTHTDFVPDEVIDRFCLLGPVDHQVARLEQLRELGVDQFALYLQHDAQDATLSAYGSRVIPAVNAPVQAKA